MTADPEAVAHWQSQLNAALADHDAAEEVLVAAKAKCDAACADAQAAVVESPTEENRLLEEVAHQGHKAELDAAYARFGAVGTAEQNLKRAGYGLPPVGPNHAPPGVTEISADIVVASEVAPG